MLVHTGTKLRNQDSTRFKQSRTRLILLRVTLHRHTIGVTCRYSNFRNRNKIEFTILSINSTQMAKKRIKNTVRSTNAE